MSTTSPTSVLDVTREPGKPAILLARAAGDATSWAGEHRGALRGVLDEHGSVLVAASGCAMRPRSAPSSRS